MKPSHILAFIALCMLTACEPSAPHAALTAMPRQLVWAWERKEDLRWLPADVGVAYLATAITLTGDKVRLHPRANPLLVRPDTALVPVVHVDAPWQTPAALNASQKQALVEQVLRVATVSKQRVVQLDFEARRSQRAFLFDVVSEIRRRLPAHTALSVTALASWCAGDYWMARLPADEIVPMAFRMGRDDRIIRAQLASHGRFRRAGCTDAIGEATDEPVAAHASARRYYFSPQPWTRETWLRLPASKDRQNPP